MLIEKGINKFLFCCLTNSELSELKKDIDNYSSIYRLDCEKDKTIFSCLNSDFKNSKILGFLPSGELVYVLGNTTYFHTIKQ